MCLERKYTKKGWEKILAGLPEEFTVWKVVVDHGMEYKEKWCESRYITDCRTLPVYGGEMKFKTNIIPVYTTYAAQIASNCAFSDISFHAGFSYKGGGHFWLHKKDAQNWVEYPYQRVIRCRVKKKWITTVGEQGGGIVIVVKRAVFPKYIGQAKPKDKTKTEK